MSSPQEALAELGASIQVSKSNKALVVDFRPIAAEVTDCHLEQVASLVTIREIYLEGAQITDAGLKHLVGLDKLATLDLQRTSVTDQGLLTLKTLPALKLLLLTGSQVTRVGVQGVRKSMLGTRIVLI